MRFISAEGCWTLPGTMSILGISAFSVSVVLSIVGTPLSIDRTESHNMRLLSHLPFIESFGSQLIAAAFWTILAFLIGILWGKVLNKKSDLFEYFVFGGILGTFSIPLVPFAFFIWEAYGASFGAREIPAAALSGGDLMAYGMASVFVFFILGSILLVIRELVPERPAKTLA